MGDISGNYIKTKIIRENNENIFERPGVPTETIKSNDSVIKCSE